MAVPLLDLTRQYAPIRADIDRAVQKVFDHCGFILGPEVKELETKLAAFCGATHALGVASGTDALLLALRACGVGPGDEVITSAFSFFASAGVISHLGATPVFVDIEPETFNIDPRCVEKAITPRTKAIMPIHLFGQCADMDPLLAIAKKHNIKIIEDAAQAIGSRYKGRQAGSMGDLGCFSFFPTKNLGCAGDGGLVVTSDDELAERVRILRQHGGKTEYLHQIVGYNSRLDTVQAAVLLVKLPHLAGWTEARRARAARYDRELTGLPLRTPLAREWGYHIYNQYSITLERRDELMAWLKERKIGHKIYYPVPFHMQECFAGLGYKKGDIPYCEQAARTVVSLPIFGEMTAAEQDEVIDAIRRFFA